MIQWYPGHMAKAKREIREKLRIIDIVVELRDSRVPVASSNPDLPNLLGDTTRIIVLNKADLSDPSVTEAWVSTFSSSGDRAVPVQAVSGKGLAEIKRIASSVASELCSKMAARGRRPRPARMLVVGVPNVGKSTFINRLAGRSAARTGDRPGVTRGQQWVSVGGSLQLLDTPGLLWPRFDDQEVGIKLAVTSAVDDKLTDLETLSQWLIRYLSSHYPDVLLKYSGAEKLSPDPDEVVHVIGSGRGCLMSGGRVDTLRTAEMILKDFRSGRIGRVSLERPGD